MSDVVDIIAKELSHDFGSAGPAAARNAARNVIDAITTWASENRTEAAPWEEHFVGLYGPWEYQFQHKVLP